MDEAHGYICGPRVYEYQGWTFEVNPSSGPWPCRKDGELRARAGRQFWKVWKAFCGLTEKQRKRYRIGGGCVRF
jgi:hypothetical protein